MASTLGLATLSSCMEPTGIGRATRVALSLHPQFSEAEATSGPIVDQVHLVLTRPPATRPVIDTTVSLLPGADSVALSLSVPVVSGEDHFEAAVDLLSGGVVLYHGTSELIVSADGSQPSFPPISVAYVGPGAGARSLAISPRGLSNLATGGATFSAAVLDSLGHSLTNVPIIWGTSDIALATISSTGQLTGLGIRGVVIVHARTLSGLSDSVLVSLVPAPSRIVVISGNGQSARAGTTLPLPVVVEVDAVDGPVPGAAVTFSAGTPGGSVTPTQVTTDASGRVSVQVGLANTAGVETFTAAVGGVTAALSETATVVPTSIAKVSGDAQSDSLGNSLKPFVVKVSDAFGNPAPGAAVTWTRVAGSGGFPALGAPAASAGSSTADAQGLATITYTLGAVPGAELVSATLAGGTAAVSFSATAIQRGVATLQVLSGDGQSGVVGTQLAVPMVVKATDAIGNPVSGAAIKFKAVSVGASVSPATVSTNPVGTASATVTLGSAPGTQSYTASSGPLSVTVSETATRGSAAKIVYVSGNMQVDTVGRTLLPFFVRVTDALGNPTPGASVDWARIAGVGTLASAGGSTSTIADSTGLARASYSLGSIPRTDSVRGTVTGGTSSVLFTATGIQRGISRIVLVSGDNQSATTGTALAAPLVVRAVDALGNPLIGIGISFGGTAAGASASPATAITDATGTASTAMTLGGVVGVQQFSAVSGTATLTVIESGLAPVPAGLQYISGNNQADSACAVLKLPFTVRAVDASGNVAPGANVIWSQVGEPEDHTTTAVLATLATDAGGLTSVSYRLPNDIGTHWVTATLDKDHSRVVMFTMTTTRTVAKGCSTGG